MWAVRLVNALVERGAAAGLVLHPEPTGQSRIGLKIDARVKRFACAERFGEGADLARVAGVYRGAIEEMSCSGGPVVLSPNLHGDCYGVVAGLMGKRAECDVRVLGWQHSDNEYDARVLVHYESILSGVVAVSDAIEVQLKERLGGTRLGEACHPKACHAGACRVVNIPYGVPVPVEWPARRRVQRVRMIYTGRMEHMQKRVLSLLCMSEELEKRRVAHSLTLLGDGPAAKEVDARAARLPHVRRVAPLGPLSVAAMLEEHDALVLPSRFEGLSVSVLEAMAHGCVPIVARTRSGSGQAVAEGCGLVVHVSEDAEEEEVGAAMADAVERFAEMDRGAMSRKAWERARDEFSIERHVERVLEVMRWAVAEERRMWPREGAWAFSGGEKSKNEQRTVNNGVGVVDPPRGSGLVEEPLRASGSVPADGAARMKALLESLAGRSVVIHGTGEHTRQLKEVIVNAPVKIVAFADDDRGKHGTRLWDWPVISPREAGVRGASDVVISSWMHQEAVWGRRGVYEGMGVRVWRVYS